MTGLEYKARREKLGLTQVELARVLEVTRMTVSKRENGKVITREAALAITALEQSPQTSLPPHG
jgi:DNA-binding XRE family transcriptional regulator